MKLLFSRFRKALSEWQEALKKKDKKLLREKALEVEKIGNEILKGLGPEVKSGYNVEQVIEEFEKKVS